MNQNRPENTFHDEKFKKTMTIKLLRNIVVKTNKIRLLILFFFKAEYIERSAFKVWTNLYRAKELKLIFRQRKEICKGSNRNVNDILQVETSANGRSIYFNWFHIKDQSPRVVFRKHSERFRFKVVYKIENIRVHVYTLVRQTCN